ncbi:MAG: UvrD-helicase domain-containing protein [Nanoarchaeota archaeon]
MGKELDYVFVLRGLQDIPFGVGRKLLIDFLQGNYHETVKKHKLYKKPCFGCLAYDKEELGEMINSLTLNGLIAQSSVNGSFWKVLELTEKGRQEIIHPELFKRKLAFGFRDTKTTITDDDRRLFDALKGFLEGYNDAQKKAIVCSKERILCLAGAGSGKTAVLTKRIEFLATYRGVDPKRILAITFTRKARHEMIARLEKAGHGAEVQVETFNSFCERILRQHADIAYGKPVRVVSYKDRVLMVQSALQATGVDMPKAIDIYFSYAQRRGKSDEELANILMADCFFIRDYFNFKARRIERSAFAAAGEGQERSADLIIAVCNFLDAYMRKHGLRDFADQLMDTIALFTSNPGLIPRFDHVLIDEFQDVNATQMDVIALLSPQNLFCVGDPRQSIYGWRGSDIRYILSFEERFPEGEVITLTKNYRSTKHIVELANTAIRDMGLPDLESALEGEKDVRLLRFDNEDAEHEFVVQRILASGIPRGEIFVLARTNRQLAELSSRMATRQIRHVVRSGELRRTAEATDEEVTLATIHAIKGLEAEMVFVVGCAGQHFPCKGSEHPIVDMVNVEEYDKEEEERRLFYVALSRAKKSLYISYTGKRTLFITNTMLSQIEEVPITSSLSSKDAAMHRGAADRLKEWRRGKSVELGVPPYVIMHDRTLIDLVQKQPLTIAELECIYGLGPTRIMRYGEELLKIVHGP